MARDFTNGFYNTTAWKKTRAAYAKSVGCLCERCLKKGLYNPGVVVHHKTHLSPENINNPDITLSWDNLMLLCVDCHAAVHTKADKRYCFDENGNVIAF